MDQDNRNDNTQPEGADTDSLPAVLRRKLQKNKNARPRTKAQTRTRQLDAIGIFDRYNLSETDKTAIQYRLRFPDITAGEIADLLGVTRGAVTLIFSKPAVQQTLAEFEGHWLEKLEKAKEKATNKLIRHIDNPNPAISIRACEDILGIGKQTATDKDKGGTRTLEDLLFELRGGQTAGGATQTTTQIISTTRTEPIPSPNVSQETTPPQTKTDEK